MQRSLRATRAAAAAAFAAAAKALEAANTADSIIDEAWCCVEMPDVRPDASRVVVCTVVEESWGVGVGDKNKDEEMEVFKELQKAVGRGLHEGRSGTAS